MIGFLRAIGPRQYNDTSTTVVVAIIVAAEGSIAVTLPAWCVSKAMPSSVQCGGVSLVSPPERAA